MNRKIFKELEPAPRGDEPQWWHHSGKKVEYEKHHDGMIRETTRIALGSPSGVLIEIGSPRIKNHPSKEGERVRFNEVTCTTTRSTLGETKHKMYLSDEDLRSAFGVSDDSPEDAEHYLKLHGGTAAAIGKFIRYHQFLNMPCPGTGEDGDPNVSVLVTAEMTEAVRKLTDQPF